MTVSSKSGDGRSHRSDRGAHTPGPWTAVGSSHGHSRRVLLGSDGNQVGWAEPSANADRIVACVNACEGMDTETLVSAGLAETVATIDAGISALRANNAALRAAADVALNALVGCCIPAGGSDDRHYIAHAKAQLRAALKAGGTP